MEAPTPTPGFEFPVDARDKVEQALRNINAKHEPVRSVRPNRQPPPKLGNGQPLVMPDVDAAHEGWGKVEAKPPPHVEAPKKISGNQLPNSSPPPTAIGTADYVSLDLPSKFAYYPFKDLYIKAFRIPHLAKMAKIDETSSMQLLAETVSSVLVTPGGDKNIAFTLSMPDLNAVMFWLRLNSFAKKSMRVRSQCTDKEHNHKVEEGWEEEAEDGTKVHKKMAPESLVIETTYTESQMVVNYLETVPDPEHYHIMIEGERLNFRPERVQDAIEFLDAPNWKDEEFQYKTRVAAVLDLENFIPTRRWTLEDKVKFVDEMLSTDDALLALEFNDLTSEYGLVETVATKCIGCGASGQVRLTIDARCFLTPDF